MADPRIRRASSKRDLDNLVDDFVTQGYEILERGERNAMVKKKSWGTGGGHVLWALLTVWFTFGIGNIIYAFIAHSGADKVLIKLDED